MLVYNYEKELLGIDAKDLELLGFSTLAQLKAETADFADLFVKKPGFVHNFQHVHWIDFVKATDDNSTPEVVICVKNKEYQATLQIESIYLSDEPSLKAFLVYLNDLREINSESKKTLTETSLDELPIEIEMEQDNNFSTPDETETFDLELASKELGLPSSMIKEFVQDFIKQSLEYKENLYLALEKNDLTTLKALSHKLKGVSANLRVDDIFEILSSVKNSSDNDEIRGLLDRFYTKIQNLSNLQSIKKQTSKEEMIDDLSDDIFLDIDKQTVTNIQEANDLSLEIMYDKDLIAKNLGISSKNFEELFNDFINEAKYLSRSINDAVLEDNPDAWTIEAIKLKGLSENMQLLDLKKELEKITNTTDKEVVQNSINKIELTLDNLSSL